MDGEQPARRPTMLVLSAVGLFLLAVVLGRLLIKGGAAWGLFALLVPVVLVALSVVLGFRIAVALTATFTVVVLTVRWLLRADIAGWVVFLLLPVVVFTAILVGRVMSLLLRRETQLPPEAGSDGEETGGEGEKGTGRSD